MVCVINSAFLGSEDIVCCEERNEMAGPKIPEVPFVPKTIFANLNSPNTALGTYEVREKVLESLKQRVPIVDACAQFKTAEHADVYDE